MLMQLDNSPMATELKQHMAAAAEQRHKASGERAGRPPKGTDYGGMYSGSAKSGGAPASELHPASELQPEESVPNVPAPYAPSRVSSSSSGSGNRSGSGAGNVSASHVEFDAEDQPEAFGSVRGERPMRSAFDDDEAADAPAAAPPSYSDMRSRHRQQPQAQAQQRPPPPRTYGGAPYGETTRVNDQGLTDPVPKPTSPND